MNNKFFKIIFLLLGVAYPFVSYFLVDHPLGAYITIGFIVLLLLRSVFVNKYFFFVMLFAAIVLILAIIFCDKKIAIMLYPVVISISMTMIFVISIYYPPTLIEKIARLTNPDLEDNEIQYTKKVTIVWACFCFFNAIMSGITIVSGIKYWTLYNGCVSYILMGLLFILEFSYRKYFFYNSSRK